MDYQSVFQRYEMKYLLTREQKEALLEMMEPYMAPDIYGHTSVRNIYYDTDTYRLARRSLEKPVYKEKLRVRGYGRQKDSDPVFVELKKKYQSVVYKRRLSLPQCQVSGWLERGEGCPRPSQIGREIDYFCQYYQSLRPVLFLSYERDAFVSRQQDDFRITFDEKICGREEALSLDTDPWGVMLLEGDMVLMEMKTAGGIPLWMTRFLTGQRLFQTSYSKYGTAYRKMIFPRCEGGQKSA